MRTPIIGYVITDPSGGCLGMSSYGSKEERSILWRSCSVTLFPTRKAAKQMIARTLKYAAGKNYNWDHLHLSRIEAVKKPICQS